FVDKAVEAYFKNNTYNIWKLFMPRFRGTAGINAYSPTSVDKLVTVSLISPIAIGFGYADGVWQMGSFSALNAARVAGYEKFLKLDPMGEVAQVYFDGEKPVFKIYSLSKKRELTQAEIEKRIQPITPLKLPNKKEKKDPLSMEMARSPKNLDTTYKEFNGFVP